jgi:nitroreductase
LIPIKAAARQAVAGSSRSEAYSRLVFLADTRRSEKTYGLRGATLVSVQDATIAAAYAQLSATAQGLGSCWVGAFDEQRVAKLLEVPAHFRPIVLMPIGYPAGTPARAERRPVSYW